MKYFAFCVLLMVAGFVLCCSSCHYTHAPMYDEFNDSKEALLDHIDMELEHAKLSDRDYALLVVKNSELRDSLRRPLLTDTLLLRACSYYTTVRDPLNESKCHYYLGRYYANEQMEDKAMYEYLLALELADSTRQSNFCAYICSYMGDLYAREMDTELAYEYYKKAEHLFFRAGNIRSQIIAIRDQGYTYSLELLHSEAIGYYMRADSMLALLPSNARLHSSLLNRIGFSYMKLNDLERARTYFNRSILLNPDNLSARFSLVKLDIARGSALEARSMLHNLLDSFPDLASQHQIHKRLYKLEKSVGRYDLSLYHLEQTNMYLDSLLSCRHNEELLSVEKKYRQEQIRNANMRLRLERNRMWLTSAVLVILLIVSFLLYREELEKKRRKNLELQRESELHRHQAEKERLAKESREKELIQKNQFIQVVKDSMFRNSVICQKIKLLSNLPIQNLKKATEYQKAVFEIFGDPDFSESDKRKLYDVTNGVYPGFTKRLKLLVPSLTEDELQFCCLLLFNLSLNEIAIILNIAVTTVKSKRYRIMVKAGMTNSNTKLEIYLHSVAEPSENDRA